MAKDNTSRPAPPQVYNWRVYALAVSAAMGSAMFGYDSAFIGGTMALPSFQDRFGLSSASGDALANLRANIVSTFQAGCFFGVIAVYMATERFGRRWPLIICGFVFNIGAVMQVASRGILGLIYAGRALTGLAVGASSMVIPIYISESSPPAIRGKLIGVFEIFLQTAQIFGFWVNYGVNIHISASDDSQWHIPFALQFIPGGLLSICMWFQPESPRWLLNANRIDQARQVLQRLRQLPADDEYLEWEVSTVLQQIEQERALGAHQSFVSKVKEIATVPANRKRLLLGVALMFIQNLSGINAMNYYSPSIFQAIGFTGTSVGLLATGVFGIVKAGATAIFMIWGIERIGRRNALLIGSAGAMTALLYIGAFAKVTGSFEGDGDMGGRSAGAYVAIVMIYVFAVFYAMSWNGIPWIFCAEVFPMAIRSACMLFTTCAQWLGQFTIVYSTPYMMTNITYGTFFLFGFSVLFGICFAFAFIPETKGLSLEDMDILFNQSGLAFTWRKKTDRIIQDRADAGMDDHIATEKRNASHVESSQV
ncbi:hypothetical protein NLU13_1332 [Sarocladium strictum]|uniref:Quinate transporter n=1 Tax=Sarocladium strictum TaxID=5046 RepID=A0AA39LC47_SARSR|nr:hypothetical protein NLU13_1332 [Sarocladium strictum]